ncbi:MAG: imelysin family protein [Spirosomataceae bacterium]
MKRIVCCLLIGLLPLWGCDSTQNGDPNQDFDRKALLENMANDLIIPAFSTLQQKVTTMETAIRNFTQNPNATTLATAQQAWEEAYIAWQSCNAYNFGPGELPVFGTLTDNIGVFPVSTLKIENNITNQNLSFDNFDRDARGFLALDYLLFDLGGNERVLPKFSNSTRREYTLRVAQDIASKVATVVTGWQSYKNTFVSNTGTDAGSSTAVLYNEFVKSFEAAKNFKVQLPAGQRAGQTSPEPTRVEAYYSGKSLLFLSAHLTAIQNIWEGKKANGQDGVGFEEYLAAVEGGPELITQTRNQLTSVRQAKSRVPAGSLSQTIQTNLSIVQDLGVELQKQTRFYKSDMASLLGIAITFNSGDGD